MTAHSQSTGVKKISLCSWHILMRMRAPKVGSCDPVAPLELPHSLHAFHRVSPSDELNVVRHRYLLVHLSYKEIIYSNMKSTHFHTVYLYLHKILVTSIHFFFLFWLYYVFADSILNLVLLL